MRAANTTLTSPSSLPVQRCLATFEHVDNKAVNNQGAPSDSAPEEVLPPGTELLGRYVLEGVLGSGGMATVYRAWHRSTGRRVAIKLIRVPTGLDPVNVARFREEAKAACRVRSDHVVSVYDFHESRGQTPVLVMELLEGESLSAALRRGPFTSETVLDLGCQLLRGLEAAHAAGVLHRDLKPANLFLETLSDGRVRLKILDFGVSRLNEPSREALTRAGQFVGTLGYLAPEILLKLGGVPTPGVDLFSAAVCLFVMLVGRRPWHDRSPMRELARVLKEAPPSLASVAGRPFPVAVEAFFRRALQRDPAERFQSATEMRIALETALRGSEQPAEPGTMLLSDDDLEEITQVQERRAAETSRAMLPAPPAPAPQMATVSPSATTALLPALSVEEAPATPRLVDRPHAPFAVIVSAVAVVLIGGFAALASSTTQQGSSAPPAVSSPSPAPVSTQPGTEPRSEPAPAPARLSNDLELGASRPTPPPSHRHHARGRRAGARGAGGSPGVFSEVPF